MIQEHVRDCKEESARVKLSVPCRLGVRYQGQQGTCRSTLDVYGTELLGSGSPIFVYIPGGYWQAEEGPTSAYPVAPLYANGIVSIIVDYDRAPGSKCRWWLDLAWCAQPSYPSSTLAQRP